MDTCWETAFSVGLSLPHHPSPLPASLLAWGGGGTFFFWPPEPIGEGAGGGGGSPANLPSCLAYIYLYSRLFPPFVSVLLNSSCFFFFVFLFFPPLLACGVQTMFL